MSATIENRIVEMEFDNKDFEKNVAQSLDTISALKKSIINLQESAENLKGLTNPLKGVDFSSVGNAIENIQNKLGSLKNFAVYNVAKDIGSALVGMMQKVGSVWDKTVGVAFGQANTGGKRRALNIEQANFQLEGVLKNAELAKQAVAAANKAVTDTAYGLDEASLVAAQFAATGIRDMDKMADYLRGVAGVAAMGGKSFTEVGHVFSVVAGQGKLMGNQLNQLATYGVSAASEITNFFNAVSKGEAEGVSEKVTSDIKSLTKGLGVSEATIREFVSKGKISFEIFAEAMDYAFGQHAKDANNTFEGSLSNMKAALNRIGEQFWTPVLENAIPVFNQTKKLINAIKDQMPTLFDMWSKLAKIIGGEVTVRIRKITEFLNKGFKTENIEFAGKALLGTLVNIVTAIRDAYKAAFPGDMTSKINGLGELIRAIAERIYKISKVLKGPLTAVLTAVFKLIKGIGSILKSGSGTLSVWATNVKKIINVLGTVVKLIAGLAVYAARHINLSQIFNSVFQRVVSLFNAARNAISNFFAVTRDGSTVIGKLTQKFTSFLKVAGGTVLKGLVTAVGAVVTAFKKLRSIDLTKLQNGIVNTYNKVKEFVLSIKQIPIVSEAINNVKSAFESLKNFITRFGITVKSFFSSFTMGSRSMSRSVVGDMTTTQKALTVVQTTIKVLAGIISTALLGALKAFNTAFEFVKSFNIQGIIERIKELIGSIKEFGLVKTVIETFQSTGGSLIDVVKAVIEKIKEFITNVKEGGINVDFFKDKISGLIQFLVGLKDALTNALFNREITRGGGGGAFGSFLDTVKEKFTNMKNTIVNGLAKIRENGLLTKILMVAYSMAILKALVSIPNSLARVTKAMKEGSGVFGTIKQFTTNLGNFFGGLNQNIANTNNLFAALIESVKQWGQAQQKSKVEVMAETFRSIAISVAILAGSLGALALVDSEKLKAAAWALGILAGALIAISGAMTMISAKNTIDDSFFRSFALNMLAMTASIAVLAGALAILSSLEMSLGRTLITLGILAAIMGGMYLLSVGLSKLDFVGTATLRSSMFIVSFAGAILMISKALAQIASINMESFDENMFANLLGAVVAFGGLALMCSRVKVTNAAAVLILLKAFEKMYTMMASVGELDWPGVINQLGQLKGWILAGAITLTAIVSIAEIMLAMITGVIVKTIGQLGKGLMMAGAGFAAFGVGLLLVVSAIKKLTKIKAFENPDAVGTFIGILIAIFAGFIALYGVTAIINRYISDVGITFIKIAGAFALLGVAMTTIAVTALLMKFVDWKGFWRAIIAMGELIAGMALVLAASKGSENLGFKPIIAMLLGITLLMGFMIILATMCSNDAVWQSIQRAVVSMGIILALMALVLSQGAKMKSKDGWKSILSMVAMLGVIFGGLYLLSTQINSLGDIAGLALVAGLVVGVIWALTKVTESFAEFAKKNDMGRGKWVMKSMAMMGIMVGAFAVVALAIIAVNKLCDFAEVAITAILLVGAVMGLAWAATKLADIAKDSSTKDLLKAGAIMLGMTALLAIVATVFLILNAIDFNEGFVAKVVALGLIFAELTLLSILVEKFGTTSANGFLGIAGLALMVLLFTALAGVVALISTLPMENALTKTQTVMLVMAELLAITAICGPIGMMAAQVAAGELTLLAMIVLFGALALVISLISSFPLEGTLAKTQIVVLVLTELTAIVALCGVVGMLAPTAALGELTLLLMVGIFAALALVCNIVANLPLEGLLAKTQIVVLVLTELTAIVALCGVVGMLAPTAALGELTLLLMVGIFAALTLVVGMVNQLPAEGLMEKLQNMVLILLELEGLVAILGIISPLAILALAGAGSLVLICLAMIEIAAALALLQNVNPEQMQATIDVLVAALWSLIGVGVAGVVGGPGLMLLAGGITALGNACVVAGTGFSSAAQGIAELGAALPILAMSISMIGQSISASLIQTGKAVEQTLKTIISSIITGLQVMLNQAVPLVYQVARGLGEGLVKGFRDGVGWNSPPKFVGMFFSDFKKYFSAEGLISIGTTEKTMLGVGKGAEEGFRDGAGWHSEQKFLKDFFGDLNKYFKSEGSVTEKIAKFVGEKLGISFTDGAVSELISGKGEIAGELNDIYSMLGQFGQALNLAKKGYSSTLSDYEYQLQTSVTSAKNKLKQMQSKGDWNRTMYSTDEINAQKSAVAEAEKKLADYRREQDKTGQSALDLGVNLDDLGKGLDKTGGSASKAKDSMDDLYDSMLQTIEGSMNIFDKFEEKDPMSADQMLENMHSQINGMTSWAADMNKLATMGIDQGLLQKLAELGPEGRDKVHAFATMTAEQLAEANTLWAQSLQLPKQVTDMMMYDMKVAGANAALGLGDGIKSEADAAANEAKAMGDEVVRTVKEDSLEEQSPSKVMHQIGAYATEGLRKGMVSMQNLLFNQAEYIANRVVQIMTQGLNPEKFSSIGVGVVDGIITGVESKTSVLKTAITKLANAATAAAKSKPGFDVNSPSKKFIPIGENITEGLVVGINRSTGHLVGAIGDQASTALDGMRNIVSTISQMITDDMEDPVIRPVLDLSNVQAGARTLSSLFNNNQALSAQGSMNNLQNGKSIGGGIIFNQYNTSPKALSRIDIYRDTRNILSQYRQATS